MRTSMRLLACVSGIAATAVSAAPLREGEFTRVINDVRILPAGSNPVPAKLGARINGSSAVATGAQSRAEIRFPDNTLTRVGANSVFRMDLSSRTVDMEKGVIMLQVPKQLGGAKVRTAAVTAAITGTTILLEFTPDGFMKIIVIEGEVDVSLNERRNQFRTLTAGDMWISRTNDKTGLPMPVQVDLDRLKKTSKLLDEKEFGALGNQKQMTAALKEQGNKKENGELVDTAFQIQGRGRNVSFLVGGRQHISDGEPTSPVTPPAPEDNKQKIIAGTTIFENQSRIETSATSFAYNTAAGGFSFLPGSDYLPAQDGPFGEYVFDDPLAFTGLDPLLSDRTAWSVLKFDELYISGNPAVATTSESVNLIMGATGDINFKAIPPFAIAGLETSDQWILDSSIAALVFPSLAGSIHFEGFNLTGTSQDVGFYAGGLASDVNLKGLPGASVHLPQGGFEVVAGRDVDVSRADIEAKTIKASAGRDVKLAGAKLAASDSIHIKARQGVKITNSTQLRRLSQMDNPEILIESSAGSVELVDGSSVEAAVATVSSQRGDVMIMNSSIAASVIKARVFDSGGTLLISSAILGKGTNASDLIRLYGEGSGGVRFVGDTTLRGNIVEIAGTNVTIDAGSRVRLANPNGTTVFADSHQYNNGINGNFTRLGNSQSSSAPANVTQQPFSSRPGF